jgi:hypothetical protein
MIRKQLGKPVDNFVLLGRRNRENTFFFDSEISFPEITENFSNFLNENENKFSFDDLIFMGPKDIQNMLVEIDPLETLAIAMSGISVELDSKIKDNISEKLAPRLDETISTLPKPSKEDIQQAQTQIILICRKLEQEEKINPLSEIIEKKQQSTNIIKTDISEKINTFLNTNPAYLDHKQALLYFYSEKILLEAISETEAPDYESNQKISDEKITIFLSSNTSLSYLKDTLGKSLEMELLIQIFFDYHNKKSYSNISENLENFIKEFFKDMSHPENDLITIFKNSIIAIKKGIDFNLLNITDEAKKKLISQYKSKAYKEFITEKITTDIRKVIECAKFLIDYCKKKKIKLDSKQTETVLKENINELITHLKKNKSISESKSEDQFTKEINDLVAAKKEEITKIADDLNIIADDLSKDDIFIKEFQPDQTFDLIQGIKQLNLSILDIDLILPLSNIFPSEHKKNIQELHLIKNLFDIIKDLNTTPSLILLELNKHLNTPASEDNNYKDLINIFLQNYFDSKELTLEQLLKNKTSKEYSTCSNYLNLINTNTISFDDIFVSMKLIKRLETIAEASYQDNFDNYIALIKSTYPDIKTNITQNNIKTILAILIYPYLKDFCKTLLNLNPQKNSIQTLDKLKLKIKNFLPTNHLGKLILENLARTKDFELSKTIIETKINVLIEKIQIDKSEKTHDVQNTLYLLEIDTFIKHFTEGIIRTLGTNYVTPIETKNILNKLINKLEPNIQKSLKKTWSYPLYKMQTITTQPHLMKFMLAASLCYKLLNSFQEPSVPNSNYLSNFTNLFPTENIIKTIIDLFTVFPLFLHFNKLPFAVKEFQLNKASYNLGTSSFVKTVENKIKQNPIQTLLNFLIITSLAICNTYKQNSVQASIKSLYLIHLILNESLKQKWTALSYNIFQVPMMPYTTDTDTWIEETKREQRALPSLTIFGKLTLDDELNLFTATTELSSLLTDYLANIGDLSKSFSLIKGSNLFEKLLEWNSNKSSYNQETKKLRKLTQIYYVNQLIKSEKDNVFNRLEKSTDTITLKLRYFLQTFKDKYPNTKRNEKIIKIITEILEYDSEKNQSEPHKYNLLSQIKKLDTSTIEELKTTKDICKKIITKTILNGYIDEDIDEAIDILKKVITLFNPIPNPALFSITMSEKFQIESTEVQRWLYDMDKQNTTKTKLNRRLNKLIYVDEVRSISHNFFAALIKSGDEQIKNRHLSLESENLQTYPNYILLDTCKAHLTSILRAKKFIENFKIKTSPTEDDLNQEFDIKLKQEIQKILEEIQPQKSKWRNKYKDSFLHRLIDLLISLQETIKQTETLNEKITKTNYLLGCLFEGLLHLNFFKTLYQKHSIDWDEFWTRLQEKDILSFRETIEIQPDFEEKIDDLFKEFDIKLKVKSTELKDLEMEFLLTPELKSSVDYVTELKEIMDNKEKLLKEKSNLTNLIAIKNKLISIFHIFFSSQNIILAVKIEDLLAIPIKAHDKKRSPQEALKTALSFINELTIKDVINPRYKVNTKNYLKNKNELQKETSLTQNIQTKLCLDIEISIEELKENLQKKENLPKKEKDKELKNLLELLQEKKVIQIAHLEINNEIELKQGLQKLLYKINPVSIKDNHYEKSREEEPLTNAYSIFNLFNKEKNPFSFKENLNRRFILENLKHLHHELFGIKAGLFKGLILAVTETSSAALLATGLIPIKDQLNLIQSSYNKLFNKIHLLDKTHLESLIQSLESYYTSHLEIQEEEIKQEEEGTDDYMRILETIGHYELTLKFLKYTQIVFKDFFSKKNKISKYFTLITFLNNINNFKKISELIDIQNEKRLELISNDIKEKFKELKEIKNPLEIGIESFFNLKLKDNEKSTEILLNIKNSKKMLHQYYLQSFNFAKARINYILTEWIFNQIQLVPAPFICELFSHQSAVPVIGHTHWSELKPLGQEIARVNYEHNHSPKSFNPYRYSDASPLTFQTKIAAFGKAATKPLYLPKSLHEIMLKKAKSIIPLNLQKFLQQKKGTTMKADRACVGFAIPYNEINRIFTTNILTGKLNTLDSDSYTPTFEKDPNPIYSKETLANTREGTLIIQNILEIDTIRLNPIKDEIEILIYTNPKALSELTLTLKLKELNLDYDTTYTLLTFLNQLPFLKEMSFETEKNKIDYINDLTLKEIAQKIRERY